jgi:ubiquinone/menaquinone biosynthesis C-methylase UbiE
MNLRVCPWWLRSALTSRVRRLLWDPAEILRDRIEEGQTVADIGCGSGFFTLAMARMVGPGGRVIAVDIQDQMLQTVARRTEREGLSSRVRLHRSKPDVLDLEGPLDFALLFWALHEVPDPSGFVLQIHGALVPGATLLLAEPRIHVSRSRFLEEVDRARSAGFWPSSEPRIRASHSVLLERL